MTPNEQKLKVANAEFDKLKKQSQTVYRTYQKADAILNHKIENLEDQMALLEHRIMLDKQEAKLLTVLRTGKQGVFDERIDVYGGKVERHSHTYWMTGRSTYEARAATKKVRVFQSKDQNYNRDDAKYYAIHGKLKPAPKVAKTTVDIGALNRALVNTG